ncbi:AsmA family protein [Chryseosolibacter indicus]|uniref:AsmA family protein n=1 Tax=Chryseosolibacter indicus TaxID=2782351 RepID=A0ABS5VNP9_9BACT|nr:AsmA-like C-terminal region-containing protein [Chryseosolibacter indicus]MBT1703048.1 AsmA family protein [Chryseosolibacter indicus]
MKKIFKWVFIVLGGLLVLILAAAFILPIVFKDEIKAAIEKEIAKSVNADVFFEDFNVTLFRSFPNVTAELKQVGVINRAPFEGQVLFATQEFTVDVNIMDLLGDQLRVKGISLVKPVINIKVLPDGRANYDIAYPSTDTTTTSTTDTTEFSFGIDHWEIVDADVTYNDQSLPYVLVVKGLNHSGSGDFTQDVFDLKTRTTADTVTTSFDGVEYLTNKKAEIDATLTISEGYTKYTFKDNTAKINDFAVHFDGWFKMNENDFGMDLTFNSPESSFKSLLSLVPGIYSKDFKDIKTEGELSFKGAVKGTYSEKQMPAFNLNLLVNNAMFKYPDLPTAISNINVDLLVDNKDGIIDNTVINLKKLHLDFGSNPVDASALVTKMYPTNVDASLAAKLNLNELSKMFPMDGLEMKGNYSVNLKAKGIYDSLKKTIPAIDANMALAGGYVKSKDFPMPLENMRFTSTIKNATGKMAETVINVQDFSLLLDKEQFNANLLLQNLDDYNWDLKAKGGIDLEKITKIFPIEGMTLAGKINADLQTKGKYSDVQAERYDKLPTSGSASLKDFKYITKDLPEVTLSQASMQFDPKKIELKNLDGKIGKSDFVVTGAISNYIAYVFGNETIKGKVNFSSNLLDLNEFMTDTEVPATATTDTASYGVIPIPNNIDFILTSNVKSVKMMDYNITNAVGDIIVKDGVANLSNLKFNMLGGSFVVNGAYNTKDVNHPKYDFALKIDNLAIQQAASSFSVVQTYAPIAGLVNGKFNTDFKIAGELKQDMMPNLATVNGGGLIKIAQASLKQSKLVAGVTSLTKLNDSDEVNLKDVLMSASIEGGKLSVKPFDVNFGSYKTTVAGSTALDGTIDYTLKMNIPANKLTSQLNSFVGKYTNTKTDPNAPIPVTIGLGGTFADPKTSLIGDEQKEQAKEAVTNAAKEEGAKALEKAVKGTEAEKIIGGILGKSNKKDSTATKTDTAKATNPAPTVQDVKKQVEDEAKKKIQGLLKKKN